MIFRPILVALALIPSLAQAQNAHTLRVHAAPVAAPVAALAWSPDGKQIASASADETVKIWRLAR